MWWKRVATIYTFGIKIADEIWHIDAYVGYWEHWERRGMGMRGLKGTLLEYPGARRISMFLLDGGVVGRVGKG